VKHGNSPKDNFLTLLVLKARFLNEMAFFCFKTTDKFHAELFSRENEPPEFGFDQEEVQEHLTRVLRKKDGDQVPVTNGQGELFECVILIPTKGAKLSVQKTTKIPER